MTTPAQEWDNLTGREGSWACPCGTRSWGQYDQVGIGGQNGPHEPGCSERPQMHVGGAVTDSFTVTIHLTAP